MRAFKTGDNKLTQSNGQHQQQKQQRIRQVSFRSNDTATTITTDTGRSNDGSSVKSLDESTKSSIDESAIIPTNGTLLLDSISAISDRSSRPSLHLQSMRTHKKRDPFEYYEVLEMLGDGSMGSVCKVKKRKSAVGGSARKSFVQRRKRSNLLGMMPCLSFCLPGSNRVVVEEATKDGVLEEVRTSFDDDDNVELKLNEEAKGDGEAPKAKETSSSIVSYSGKYGVIYALKSIILDHVTNQTFARELQNEIAILQTLDHPNICKAIETFEFKKQLYLVLELCSGGDLYTRDPYDERQARHIVHSILDACTFLHRKKITHRDLKYENIMFANPTSPSVKIIDFGLSKKYSEDQSMSQTVGTVYTMAPEVIKGKYDQKCDVWSIGVLAYMLLSSSIPFFGKTRRDVAKRIMKGRFHFKARRWQSVSKEAKALVTSLLVLDSYRRPSCGDALNHEWFEGLRTAEGNPNGHLIVCPAVMDRVQATIHTYAGYTKMKKLALYVIAHKSSSDEVGFLQQIFRNRFDIEKNGIITLKEFKQALSIYSYPEEELEIMFDAIDIDGTERLTYTEFLAATIQAHGSIEEDRIAEAFDRLDSDDTGFITVSNLTEFLGKETPKDFVNQIIDEADVTKDHRIDYDEFLGLWDGTFHTKLAENLIEVRDKRLAREGAAVRPSRLVADEGEDGRFLLSDEVSLDDSTRTAPPGAGKYFFEQEKEKSVRGVWF